MPLPAIDSTMTTYPLAQHSWADEGVITVSSREGQIIGTFPLSFVQRGGINAYGYVLEVVHQLVELEDRGCIRADDGTSVSLEDEPVPGDFFLEPHSASRICFLESLPTGLQVVNPSYHSLAGLNISARISHPILTVANPLALIRNDQRRIRYVFIARCETLSLVGLADIAPNRVNFM
jgi:hypothetical protein